jgi:hypothetical protein
MRVWILSLLAVALVAFPAWAQEDVVEVEADVTVDTDLRDDVVVADNDMVDDGRRGSLREEYRRWAGAPRATARDRRDVDSVDDLESAPRNAEEWLNEDVANTDRDDYMVYRERRAVGRYANYPEYDDNDDTDLVAADRMGDRMYDDYDRRGDRYWSRSYGDVRYYDSRGAGCACKDRCDGCRVVSRCDRCGVKGKCGSKCGAKTKCGTKCGDKCGKCHKPAVKAASKCGPKCGDKCGKCHKPVARCGSKCGDKCGKCVAKVEHKAGCAKCGSSKKCKRC